MRLALIAMVSIAAMAQTAPLTLPSYDMFRYATTGRAFSYRFAPSGGRAPYTYSVEEGSSLPPGLRLDASTGELAGTISQLGEYRHSVCVTDAAKSQICVPFLVIAVGNDGDTYTEIQAARVGVEYGSLLPNLGGFVDLSYLPFSGKLPDGMVLEVTGRLYGTPRAPGGAWAFRVEGRDIEGARQTRNYVIRVQGPIVATTALPGAVAGIEYSSQLTILGDQPPYTVTVRRGPLPPGMLLSESGRISGICNLAQRYSFQLRVTDALGGQQEKEIVLNVDFTPPPLVISPAGLQPGTVGVAYRQQVTIGGGREPYTIRTTGNVPPGLTVSGNGLVSGTPTAAGTYTFTIQVIDSVGLTLFKAYTVTVGNLRYSGPSAYTFYVSEPVKVTLTAEGGLAPYQFAVASGTMPAGLTLSDKGELSGTPTTEGTSNLTVRVTDGAGRVITAPIDLLVSPPRPQLSANGIVNAASYAGGGVTPGEIVTVYGTRLGPPNLAPFLLDSNNRVPASLAGTRVLFGGQAAPLLYVSAGQIGAIVPYSVAGKATIDVVVDANGVRSEALSVPVAAAVPGLFTADASGKGQAAALNQDGTVNGRTQAAKAGDVVVLYGTGEGRVVPNGQDGVLTGTDTPRPVQAVQVTIGGKDAAVLYAGAAPGLVAGVFQVNVRIPADVAGEAVPVVLKVGEASSAAGVTLAIR